METARDYEGQAQRFLDRFGIKFSATWKSRACPPWEDVNSLEHGHGDQYGIRLSKGKPGEDFQEIRFPFWNSANDRANGKQPTPYDVLACISSDVYTPETFEEFCSEYGYDQDSRKAESLFRRADRFAAKLRTFFSAQEIETLSEIQ